MRKRIARTQTRREPLKAHQALNIWTSRAIYSFADVSVGRDSVTVWRVSLQFKTYGSSIAYHVIDPPRRPLNGITDWLVENQFLQSLSVCSESKNLIRNYYLRPNQFEALVNWFAGSCMGSCLSRGENVSLLSLCEGKSQATFSCTD